MKKKEIKMYIWITTNSEYNRKNAKDLEYLANLIGSHI